MATAHQPSSSGQHTIEQMPRDSPKSARLACSRQAQCGQKSVSRVWLWGGCVRAVDRYHK